MDTEPLEADLRDHNFENWDACLALSSLNMTACGDPDRNKDMTHLPHDTHPTVTSGTGRGRRLEVNP